MLFFLLLPPPPRPTLFPYTTLFRSRPPRRAARRANAGEDRRRHEREDPRRGIRSLEDHVDRALPHRRVRDRKSTRLNSSHSSISYAVFCLKKKTTMIHPYVSLRLHW